MICKIVLILLINANQIYNFNSKLALA